MNLIQPKEVQIPQANGTEKTFVLSKFPAITGREIIAKYPLSALPKLGEYAVNEETMIKLMGYVAVQTEKGELRLSTKALIDNHCGDWETLARLEVAMLEYNVSFFGNGLASAFLKNITGKAQALIFQTLTDLSGRLSQTEKRPSTSSEQSTH
jgi:hypothetical protein